jgi:hypothetical protein
MWGQGGCFVALKFPFQTIKDNWGRGSHGHDIYKPPPPKKAVSKLEQSPGLICRDQSSILKFTLAPFFLSKKIKIDL